MKRSLNCERGDQFFIGADVRITVVEVQPGEVAFRVEGPPEVLARLREEEDLRGAEGAGGWRPARPR